MTIEDVNKFIKDLANNDDFSCFILISNNKDSSLRTSVVGTPNVLSSMIHTSMKQSDDISRIISSSIVATLNMKGEWYENFLRDFYQRMEKAKEFLP